MEPKTTGKRIVSRMSDPKQRVVVHRTGNKEEPPPSIVIPRCIAAVSVCLIIWAILSPLFYEQFYETAGRNGTGNFKDWVFSVAWFAFPLLLVCVSATRKVIVETRKQYFPPTNTNNADLPAHQTLVRASSEPLQTQEAVLLRAATEGMETPPEEMLRASVSG